MERLVLATHNKKKLVEIERIVGPLLPSLRVSTLDDFEPYDEPVETEATFEGNALLKARAAVAQTGLPVLADDSGLAVDALNGMPGVLSARWAGRPKSDERNNSLLLEQLLDVPDARRTAAFVSVVAFVLPSGEEQVVEGRVPGRILREPRGEGGFGYDPLFLPDGSELTMAELPAEAKDELSHRGRALRAVAPLVVAALNSSRRT